MVVNLASREIRGMRYGVGRCEVKIDGTPTQAIAVFADEEKFIGNEMDCIEFLKQRGLEEPEATDFFDRALRVFDEMREHRLLLVN